MATTPTVRFPRISVAVYRPDHRAYAWNRLVGAGFALWRAIPLIDDVGSESNPRKSAIQVDHGEALLDELIRHNRVTYDQEKGVARYWAAGFYLNDAEDRLISVADGELKDDLASEVPGVAKVRQNAEGRSKPVHGGRQHRCNDALWG
jgi:hypothetical protein